MGVNGVKKTIQNKKSKSKEYMEFWQQFRIPLEEIAGALKTRNKILEKMVTTLNKIEKKLKLKR